MRKAGAWSTHLSASADAMLEMGESEDTQSRPFAFYMHTDDVDALYHRALAECFDGPAYGDRLAIIEDPAGNRCPRRRNAALAATSPCPAR